MTVDKSMADRITANNGNYPGDEHLPPVTLIIKYDNAWGGIGYGCVRQGRANAYTPSPFVRNPRTYWHRNASLSHYCHDDRCELYAQPQAPRWPIEGMPICRVCGFDVEPTPPDTSWMNELEEVR